MTTSSSRFFVPDHPSLPITAKGRLQVLRTDLLAQLLYANGWDDYNKRVGRLMGIDDAIQIIADIEVDLMEKN